MGPPPGMHYGGMIPPPGMHPQHMGPPPGMHPMHYQRPPPMLGGPPPYGFRCTQSRLAGWLAAVAAVLPL